MKTTTILPLFGALTTALIAANLSLAGPIMGALDFSGGASLNGTTLGSATQVLTWTSVNVTPLGVTLGSALDTTINPGDAVTMLGPWTFTNGLASLWSVGGFTFDLTTSGIVSQTDEFLSVKGYGTAFGNNYDPTPGVWYFTSQDSGVGAGSFSFSAATKVMNSVPDGGTISIMFGVALVGFAAVACMRNQEV